MSADAQMEFQTVPDISTVVAIVQRPEHSLAPKARAILSALFEAHPRPVALGYIAQVGGFGGYRARISEIRQALEPYSWTVENDPVAMDYRLKEFGCKMSGD